MENNQYKSFTLVERPELNKKINELHSIGWSTYMNKDEVADQYFSYLSKLFPHLQYVLLDKEENAVACGNAVSFYWDGSIADLPSGWDDVLIRSVEENLGGVVPNTVSAISIVVNPLYRGKGISEIMVREMKELVRKNNFQNMVAPVRPSLKHKYPLIPMEQYAFWKTENDEPFDPWMRIHYRSKAKILAIAKESMIIKGTISDWESWVGMKLPITGDYVVSDALVPILIDIEKDSGVYIEPNVWMQHFL